MNSEFSLYDYWKVLLRRKWVLLLAFVAAVGSTVFYTNLQPVIYRTSALVRVRPPQFAARLPGAEATNWYPWELSTTEIRVIESADVAQRAAQKMGWIKPESSSSDINREVARIQGMYSATLEENSFIEITATGQERDVLADVVNKVTEAYGEFDLDEKSKQARKAVEDLGKRKEELDNALKRLEDSRKQFLADHPELGLGMSLSAQLIDLEARQKEMLKRYTSSHPEVIQLNQRVLAIKAKLAVIPSSDTDLERINRELRINEELYSSINRQYEEAKIALSNVVSYVSAVDRAVPPVKPISPNEKLNLVLGGFLGLFLGLALAFLIENLDISISTLEDIEHLLSLPVLGVVPVIPELRNDFRTRIRRLLRRERGSIEAFREKLVLAHRKDAPVIESYHTLRANIVARMEKKGPMALVFSSSGAAEGKTLTATNFAIGAVHSGLRTLLIDMDLRKPALYKTFGLQREPGLSDILLERAKFEDCVHSTTDLMMGELDIDKLLYFPGIDNLKILTCGTALPNVVDTIDSAPWDNILSQWKSQFDLIVFDSPPILLFVDGIMLAKHCDGVVLVYRSGKMSRDALKRAAEQVSGAGSRIIGVALNDISASEIGPRFGYYQDYGRYAKAEK